MEKIKTIRIFSQEWMAEDLNVRHYSNGDPILYANNDQKRILFENQKKGFYSYYNDNELNGQNRGSLYNWYAVNDPRGIAPEGFRVTNFLDWNRLIDNLGGEDEARMWFKSNSDLFGLHFRGYGNQEEENDNYEFYSLNSSSFYFLSSWDGKENQEIDWKIGSDGRNGNRFVYSKVGNRIGLLLSIRCIKI
jgi:uncharacterized protein (TIGR02145 family)